MLLRYSRRYHEVRKCRRHLHFLLLCEQLHIIAFSHSYRSHTLLRCQRRLQLPLKNTRQIVVRACVEANIYTSSHTSIRTTKRLKDDLESDGRLISQNAGMGKCLGTNQEYLLHQRRKDLHEERTRRLRRYSSNSLRQRKGRTGDEVRSERDTRWTPQRGRQTE